VESDENPPIQIIWSTLVRLAAEWPVERMTGFTNCVKALQGDTVSGRILGLPE
jgi:hypothetical protein